MLSYADIIGAEYIFTHSYTTPLLDSRANCKQGNLEMLQRQDAIVDW